MSADVHGSLGSFGDLRTALTRYAQASAEVLAAVERGAAGTQDTIAQEVSARFAAHQAAVETHAACMRQEDADCSGEARRVAQAAERLERARRAFAQCTQAIAGHQGAKQRYRREVDQLVAEGTGKLGRHGAQLEEYLASTGRGGSSASGGSAGAGSAGGSGGASSGAGETPIAGAPEGMAMVAISSIDLSDSNITGPESFGKGYSPEDLAWAHHTLHETVLPAMAAGKGLDYFRDRDAASGAYGTRCLADTYSGFFHPDHRIKLDPPDPVTGRRAVGNGYHRIWVAQQLGMTSVPADIG